MIWNEPDEPWIAPPGDLLNIPRALVRMILLVVSTLIAVIPYLIVRFGQRLFGKSHREMRVLYFWGHVALWCFGLRAHVKGKIHIRGGVITSNHINFIDIPLIFAVVPGYMMAKSEIRSWPLIGWFARLIGTEFVIRDPKHTPNQVKSLRKRLENGDRMVLFPEATTTDGQRVIPFRSSLFAALAEVGDKGVVQPVSIFYRPPKGASRNFFGFWGDASLVRQMWATFASKGIKRVDVILHEPLPTGLKRKEFACAAEDAVREGFIELKANYEAQL